MRTSQVIKLLALREIAERMRSKGFLVSGAITLVLVVGVAVLPHQLADPGPTTYDVGVSGERASEVAAALPEAASGLGDVEVDVRRIDAAEAERLVRDGDLDAVLLDDEVVVHEELDGDLEVLVQATSADIASRAALAEAGVSDPAADAALRPAPLPVRALDPPDPETSDREGLVFAGTFILYGQLLGFGYWVATGLVEDKTSRVAELMLGKVPAAQILLGKVVGIGALGFVHLVAIVGAGLTAAVATDAVNLPSGSAGTIAMVLGWFVLGFALYSALFAVGGALASRTEELQTTTTPVTLVAIISFFVAGSAGTDPGGTVARIATFFPSTAPLVLPIRQSAGELPLWELAASVAIVVATAVLAMRLATRVYAGSALHVRGPMKLRQALQAAE